MFVRFPLLYVVGDTIGGYIKSKIRQGREVTGETLNGLLENDGEEAMNLVEGLANSP